MIITTKKNALHCLIVTFFLCINFVDAQQPKSIHQLETELYKIKYKQREKEATNSFPVLKKITTEKELYSAVFGYLPSWSVYNSSSNYIRYDLLTHLAIFHYGTNIKGEVYDSTFVDWSKIISEARQNNVKIIFTVINFNPAEINIILNVDSVRQNFYSNIIDIIRSNSFDGVNVDFESLSPADENLPINNFMKELTDTLHAEFENVEVSFASPAINWSGHWDLEGLAESCDYLFIMGYEFYGGWSTKTGPSAPLTGLSKTITTILNSDYKNVVINNPQKLILGVPYYGNQWKTMSNSAYATVASGDWVGSVLYDSTESASTIYGKLWDNFSSTPWCRWQDSVWNQIWYDDTTSLQLKYNLAKQKNLKGIGIWALGYDGSREELWNLIEKNFTTPPSAITDNDNNLPNDFYLYQNYPNPFNPSTVISYHIPQESRVQICIYDLLGRKISEIVDEVQTAGIHNVYFNSTGLSSGIYFYKLQTQNFFAVKKMSIIK